MLGYVRKAPRSRRKIASVVLDRLDQENVDALAIVDAAGQYGWSPAGDPRVRAQAPPVEEGPHGAVVVAELERERARMSNLETPASFLGAPEPGGQTCS